MDKHSKYSTIIKYIKEFGEEFPKKHGKWMTLRYHNEYFLCLDTWNNAIMMRINPKYEPYQHGRYGEIYGERYIYENTGRASLGIDWGRFELYVEESLLDLYIQILSEAYGKL